MASIILAVDIGDGPVQSGFSPFPVGLEESAGAAVSHTYGGLTVTIDELSNDHLWRARDRGDLGNSGTFTQSDLLRDFMSSRDGYTISVLVAGLTPGASYDFVVWSFESPLASENRTSRVDWIANGLLVKEDYLQYGLGNDPTSNDTFQFTFSIAANTLGQILLLGTNEDLSDGVRVNGLQISGTSVPAVPEPASLAMFGAGLLALGGWRRAQRRR